MKRNRIDGLVKGTKPLLGVSVAPGGRGAKGAKRCAIYCRKSSERGLEQEFNSLDAQRESGEAYVRAMAAEGWVCLPDRYDAPPHGGYSGGSVDRPALKRLLEDVDGGRIDVVVVAKVDRLSRSLLDFVTLMGRFEERGVSFVSTTQQFNTDASMGRLTLNILLAFAQFEREIISERTRDKIALSRQRGLWTGGRSVLGYDIAPGAKLVVNEAEASVVRGIFARYVECGSLSVVCRELDRDGVRTKRWTSRSGALMGGSVMTKSRLWAMLTNVLYAGRVPHHGKVYPGVHERIIDEETYQAVQRLLARNRSSGANLPAAAVRGALSGLLWCARCACRMGHTTTRSRKGEGRVLRTYRYYTCRSRSVGGARACPKGLVPAEQMERFVLEKCRDVLTSPEVETAVLDRLRNEGEAIGRQRAGVASESDRSRPERTIAEALPTRDSVRGELGRLERGDAAVIRTVRSVPRAVRMTLRISRKTLRTARSVIQVVRRTFQPVRSELRLKWSVLRADGREVQELRRALRGVRRAAARLHSRPGAFTARESTHFAGEDIHHGGHGEHGGRPGQRLEHHPSFPARLSSLRPRCSLR